MSEAEKREALRLLRGSVMRSLQRLLTSETQATATYLFRVCRPESKTVLLEALAYLVAGDYVAETVSRIDQGDDEPLTSYRLTAKGMQLAERVLSDPSVLMD